MGAELFNAIQQLINLRCLVYWSTTKDATFATNSKRKVTLACEVNSAYDLQHSMGLEAVCRDSVLPLGWLMCTRNTNLTRVFLRPMSVSPLRSSMSELRSFRIPAQSILKEKGSEAERKAPISLKTDVKTQTK